MCRRRGCAIDATCVTADAACGTVDAACMVIMIQFALLPHIVLTCCRYVRTGLEDVVDMEEESKKVPSVQDLPPSVLVHVFANLSLRDVLRCQQVGTVLVFICLNLSHTQFQHNRHSATSC